MEKLTDFFFNGKFKILSVGDTKRKMPLQYAGGYV